MRASQVITEDLLRTWVGEVDTETPFDVYESTKNFALLLNLRLYLGLDHTKEPDLVQMFTTVASTHWHGMFESKNLKNNKTKIHRKFIAQRSVLELVLICIILVTI